MINKKEFDESYKPEFLYFNLNYWISVENMTDQDKENDPNCHIRGGQLRKLDYKEAFKKSWDNADKKDRIKIKDIPGFDRDMFYEISGINVDAD